MCDNQFPLHIGNVLLSADDFIDLLLIVDLTLVEGRLLDLDLLIENLEFLVTLDQLCAEDVSLVDYHLVVLLLLLLLLFSFSDNELEARDIALLGLNHVVTRCDLLLDLLDVSIEGSILLLVLLLLVSLSGNSIIFRLNLLFELRDLLSHSLELHLELGNLLGSF